MYAYDQPIAAASNGAARPSALANLDVLRLVRILWGRRILITLAAITGACLAVAAGKMLPTKYTSTAQLYVDPRELQLVDRELTPRAQDMSGLTMVVESQARLITSNSVLLQVIRETRIDRDPEFGGENPGVMSALSRLVFGSGSADKAGKDAQTGALEALNRHITIRKTDRSFVVDVEVWSKEPAKAAMIANAIAKTYLAESKKSQSTAARRATTDLSSRLNELQDRLRASEVALTTYKAQNNFVGTQDALISDQQLSSSNQRLAVARAQTLDAKARYDQIEASRRSAGDGGAIPEALQSQTVANLRGQYAEARKRYAELAAELGPRHPALRQAEKQVDDLRRIINEEVERYAQSAKNDLMRAREYEASLAKSLDIQKRQRIELTQASVRLRELERDVEANREVYQSFLKRSRETEEQETLNTSAARIVGEAIAPQRRSFPPPMSILAIIGLLAGALAGAGWSVAAEGMRTSTPLPRPAAPAEHVAPAIVPEKPVIAQLQDSDVIRSLGDILAAGRTLDLTRLGWPTLRGGMATTPLLNALRDIRAAAERRSCPGKVPLIAVLGPGGDEGRSMVTANFALAAAREGLNVVVADMDNSLTRNWSDADAAGSGPRRFGWVPAVVRTPQPVLTANGIALLSEPATDRRLASLAKAISHIRGEEGRDLVIMDGPALPWDEEGQKLIAMADAVVAALSAGPELDQDLEDILAALGEAESKLVGVILNETGSMPASGREKQHA